MATSSILAVFFMICMCFSSNFVLGRIKISIEEDMKLERQLKILNKPSTKTFQNEDGYIYDCVDINKQPALDHPLLKDHKVQARPSSFPPGMANPSPSDTNHQTLEIIKSPEECPIGTVPIVRTRKEDLIRARSLLDHPSRRHDSSKQKLVYLLMKPKTPSFGAGAYISVYNLSLAPEQASSATVWILGGHPDQRNAITAGWTVSPYLYNDSHTRLFTFWTGDGNHNTGCYNTLCPGFVQIHEKVTPTSRIRLSSTYGGQQQEMKVQVFQDRKTGNWWFLVSNENVLVGYWPKDLFPNMKDGSETVAWGGVAQTGKDGISPPIGNGHFPDGKFNHACYFADVHYFNDKNATLPPADQDIMEQSDYPECYGLRNEKLKYQDRNWGYSFTIGGPGGTCG